MLTRGMIVAGVVGVVGAVVALLTMANRKRDSHRDKHDSKKALACWEGEGGNLRPEPADHPRSDVPNPS